MNFLRNLSAVFIALYKSLQAALQDRLDPPYAAVVVRELPEKLGVRKLYIVEEDGYLEQAAMQCPCGCGKTLHMNLLTDERPCWTVTMNPGPTLHPSVWRKVGCGSHFWLRNGRVKFVV